MELSITGIIAGVTLLLGQLTKKIGLVDKKYLPLQSIIIGIISGVIVWVVELNDNLVNSIIYCVISSLFASGLYDTTKCIKSNEYELDQEAENTLEYETDEKGD